MTAETDALQTVAGLMALAARTAPKGRGVDSIVIKVLTKAETKKLVAAMKAYGESHEPYRFFLRDAANIAAGDACVVIGATGRDAAGINCGACGYATCADFQKAVQKAKAKKDSHPYPGPNCAIKMADLGIAVGSAAKTAQIHNADNRIMFSAGSIAIALGLMGKDCTVAYAIPLAATGKNVFFDRVWPK